MIDHTFNKACNYGNPPMPPACYVEYITPGLCDGFSPAPAYCTQIVELPPPVHAVPEPMTWALFGVGLVLMMMFRRGRA